MSLRLPTRHTILKYGMILGIVATVVPVLGTVFWDRIVLVELPHRIGL